MALRVVVELGPSPADVDQVLDVDVADVVEVIASTGHPVDYVWDVPGGAQMRLRFQWGDTP